MPGIVQWLPGLPWYEAGQVVFVEADTDGVQFQNLAFDKAVPALDIYTSLLAAYTNSSGWSMTMPSTVDVSSMSSIHPAVVSPPGKSPKRCIVPAPTLTWTATAATSLSAYNLLMTVSADCAQDKYAPLTTSPVPYEIPEVNPIVQLPAMTGCSVNATSTTTFTTAFPVRTGFISFEEYQGLGQGDFWNQTDAAWTISIANDSKGDIQFDGPQFMDGDTGSTTQFTMAPIPTAFNLTVPSWYGTRK